MRQELILFPLLSMVMLTFLVGIMLLRSRIRAVKQGKIDPRYFLFNRGARVPEHLLQLEQHYINLLELPVLFYLLTVTLYVTRQVDLLQLVLAWGFVLTRLVHTVIHTTVNRLRWRMRAFLGGALLLLAGWLLFAARLVTGIAG